MTKGRIHSVQSLGAVDGPGLRYVIFMQGCPLRCVYCHNPDTWEFAGGQEMTADELVAKVVRFKTYFGKDGGVTVSGGEPLMQAEFVTELFQKLHAQGIHTALDTSGILLGEKVEKLLEHTDLVLADLKFTTAEDYQQFAKGNYGHVRQFLELTKKMRIPIWIRHVVVPNMNDSLASMQEVKDIAEEYPNMRKLEFLPFHNLCQEKYDTMQIPFPLEKTESLSQEALNELVSQLK
ncbi:pyruvate formate-lyase-activating protein [Scatolibacter rhodanostii]|uniref:pyruvate formate-lyase-activating protein n=1 Tax=Scatolibacter rhodanostii TaxID=2014781 RepID=UPI000C06C0E4|nr:pyruvate formate-lyase-activating protein [Scatolibacter rhodanostii]